MCVPLGMDGVTSEALGAILSLYAPPPPNLQELSEEGNYRGPVGIEYARMLTRHICPAAQRGDGAADGGKDEQEEELRRGRRRWRR